MSEIEQVLKELGEFRKDMGEFHKEFTQVKTVLIGIPDTDDTGLLGLVNIHTTDISKLKRIIYTLIGILIGSGVLGGTAAAILEAMK